MSSPPQTRNTQFSSDEDEEPAYQGSVPNEVTGHEERRPLSSPVNGASDSNRHDVDEGEVQPSPRHASSFSQSHHVYAQISSHDLDIENDHSEDGIERLESDPLYPAPPPAYYQRGIPQRITHWGRLIATLAAVALACLAIAAVIDVSTPSFDGLEPGRDKRSVADSVLAAMDRSADPCDNFYEYACGSWLRSTRLPPDRTSYVKSFSSVYDRIRLIIKDLLEGDLQATSNNVTAKAGTFYASCIEQHGTGSVNTLFLSAFRDKFKSLPDASSFAKLMGSLSLMTSTVLFSQGVGVDDKNPTQYAMFLGQVDLGLPHRDNYLSGANHDVEMRRRYVTLIQGLLDPAGRAHLIPRQDHGTLAKDILELETRIANFSLPPEDMRDPDLLYNKRLLKDMPSGLHLNEFFEEMGVDERKMNGSVIVENPDYFNSIAEVMESLDTDGKMRTVVQGFLAFHLATLGAGKGLLGEKAYGEIFKFEQFVYGLKKMPEKWKTCQSLTNSMLGDAVGAAFVDQHFSDVQLNAAKTLSEQIMKAFGQTLKVLDWMDEPTRTAAEAKLRAINWKVGYSSKLDTYDDVSVSQDAMSENVVSCLLHKSRKEINKLSSPVDKTEWSMLPQEVNAYYSPSRNEMVFPAGILQPPFFSDAYPDAMNYGSIGAVVGHEMSHGFDASGRKYDKDGQLRSWWSKQSAKEYNERSQCYVDLYNTYKPRDVPIYVLGNLTLDENIADVNGMNVAYKAFKSLPNNTEDVDPPNGLLARELTNDQLFFVSYAQTWCTLYRPEALKIQMMTDPHSPGQFRVQGPLSQSDIFAEAFKCRNGTRYNPMTKCHLW